MPVTNGDVDWEQTYIHLPTSAPQVLRDMVTASLPPNPSALDKVLVEMLIATEVNGYPRFDPVAVFREVRSPVLAAAFTRFQSKQDPELICLGLQGLLLSENDPSIISTIKQRYTSLSLARSWVPLLDEIKVYYVNTAPQAVQTLGPIATDTTVGIDLRLATAGALARMHTRQSLPYLAKLLNEKDSTFRTMAVAGLSMFANNVPIGSHEPTPGPWRYRTDATIAHSGVAETNVSFWQNWWQQNQSVITNFP